MLGRNALRFIVHLPQRNVQFSSSSVSSFESIPSPRGLPLVGTTLSLILAGGPTKLHKYINKRHQELGMIFKDNVGPVTAVFLADPDEMRNIFAKEGKYPHHIKPESWLVYNEKQNYSRGLFFMDGEEWLFFRRIMNNILLKGSLNWIENSCDVATNILLNRITNQKNQEFQNIEVELYKWSMDVILSVLVGASNFEQCSKEVEPLVTKLSSTVQLVFENTCRLQLIPAKLAEKYDLKRWQDFESSVKESLYLANQLLEFVYAKYKGSDGLLYKIDAQNVKKSDINRIIIDLILSAGDTTAYTMSWVLYLTSQHKNVQLELRKQLQEDPKTPLLRNMVRETLRMYPVAPFLTRILTEDLQVSGYNVPANTLLVMSIYTSGRSSRYFKNPNMFLPNRWLRGSGEDTPIPYASLPFGIGARSCIGRKIAETQLHMTLSKINKNFDIDILNGNEIEDVLRMVSKPSKPLRLTFTKVL